MPPKRFIDKKSAVTFKVVNKGGADSETAQDKVWEVVRTGRKAKSERILRQVRASLPAGAVVSKDDLYDEDDEYGDDEGELPEGMSRMSTFSYIESEHLEDDNFIGGLEGYDDDEIAEIRRKTVDGTFPNDGYDYSRHMRERGDGVVLNALEVLEVVKTQEELIEVYKPPVLKADVKIEDVKGNQVSADNNIVDIENEDFEVLEEEADFDTIIQKMKDGEKVREDVLDSDEDEFEDIDEGEYDDVKDEDVDVIDPHEHDLKPKSLRREQQEVIDREFEEMMKEYSDDKIGEVDVEEAQGSLKVSEIKDVVDDFIKSTKQHYGSRRINDYYDAGDVKDLTDEQLEALAPPGTYALTQKERLFGRKDVSYREIMDIIGKRLEYKRQLNLQQGKEEFEESDEEFDKVEVKKEQKWDAESIISTYSNLENHPKLIIEKKVNLSKKSGIPLNVLPKKENEEEEEDDQDLHENMGIPRAADETQEEKKERKKFVKMYKKMMREQKKALKTAFKSEEVKQSKILADPSSRQKIVVKF
ncbi:ltv1 [Acrasis kona]|uniref:Ltv1 n=1 Tax=Acrasis kona TaxID=1008807 RepID=A0AAW2YTC4_9EUKA